MLLYELEATTCCGAAHAGTSDQNMDDKPAALSAADACLLQVTPAGPLLIRNMVSILVRWRLVN